MNERSTQAERLKDSFLEKIPEDWYVYFLEDLTVSIDSITYGVLKPGDYISDGIPLLQIQDVIHGKIEIDKLHRISKQLDTQYTRTRLNGNELVMSLVGTIGKVAQIPASLKGANLHRNLARIPISQENSSRFIFHYLQSQIVQKSIKASTFGSTQALLNLTVLRKLLISKPPLPEQQRIAEILDTIDRAIALTESLIQKLKQIKAGLLHDLLTCGLDENGELRNPTKHPEQFKDSPMGRIPMEWNISKIGSCLTFITDYRGMTPPYSKEGIAVISAENIGNGQIKSITKYVTEKTYQKTTIRGFPEPDDVIFTTEAPVAEIALLPSDRIYRLTRRVIALRSNASILEKRFLYWYLFRLSILGAWERLCHGSTVPRILKPEILNRVICLPSLVEQKKIISIFDAHNDRIQKEEAYRDKLKLEKKGLMQDLLTGKVRVR